MPSAISTAVLSSFYLEIGGPAGAWLARASFLAGLLWMFVFPAAEWLLLRTLGCAGASLRLQFRGAGYSLAPLALGLLPLLGCTVLPLWCCALRVLACRSLQRVEWSAAIVATASVPALATAAVLFLRLDVLLAELWPIA